MAPWFLTVATGRRRLGSTLPLRQPLGARPVPLLLLVPDLPPSLIPPMPWLPTRGALPISPDLLGSPFPWCVPSLPLTPCPFLSLPFLPLAFPLSLV